jgi:ankyrin repeat protein
MIDWADPDGQTLLSRACDDYDADEVEKLLAAKANPLVRTARSPLELAVENNSRRIVKMLLSTPQLHNNTVELNRTMVLHNCADAGIAQMLLDAKADPAWHDDDGSAFEHAVYNKQLSVLKVLVNTGEFGKHHQKALKLAISNRTHDCVEVLLGANVQPSNSTLGTAIVWCQSDTQGAQLVARLIHAKADPSGRVDKLCKSAIRCGHRRILSYMLSNYKLVCAAKLIEDMVCKDMRWDSEAQRAVDHIAMIADVPSMALCMCSIHNSAWLDLLDKSAKQSKHLVFSALLALPQQAVRTVINMLQLPSDCGSLVREYLVLDLRDRQHLMVSAWQNNEHAEPIVQALINFKVNPNGVLPSGVVPVQCRAPGWFEKIVASPCCQHDHKCKSLFDATQFDHLACMAHYLPIQATCHKRGYGPLDTAVWKNSLPAVQLLLDSKASPDCTVGQNTCSRILELLGQTQQARKRKIGDVGSGGGSRSGGSGGGSGGSGGSGGD